MKKQKQAANARKCKNMKNIINKQKGTILNQQKKITTLNEHINSLQSKINNQSNSEQTIMTEMNRLYTIPPKARRYGGIFLLFCVMLYLTNSNSYELLHTVLHVFPSVITIYNYLRGIEIDQIAMVTNLKYMDKLIYEY